MSRSGFPLRYKSYVCGKGRLGSNLRIAVEPAEERVFGAGRNGKFADCRALIDKAGGFRYLSFVRIEGNGYFLFPPGGKSCAFGIGRIVVRFRIAVIPAEESVARAGRNGKRLAESCALIDYVFGFSERVAAVYVKRNGNLLCPLRNERFVHNVRTDNGFRGDCGVAVEPAKESGTGFRYFGKRTERRACGYGACCVAGKNTAVRVKRDNCFAVLYFEVGERGSVCGCDADSRILAGNGFVYGIKKVSVDEKVRFVRRRGNAYGERKRLGARLVRIVTGMVRRVFKRAEIVTGRERRSEEFVTSVGVFVKLNRSVGIILDVGAVGTENNYPILRDFYVGRAYIQIGIAVSCSVRWKRDIHRESLADYEFVTVHKSFASAGDVSVFVPAPLAAAELRVGCFSVKGERFDRSVARGGCHAYVSLVNRLSTFRVVVPRAVVRMEKVAFGFRKRNILALVPVFDCRVGVTALAAVKHYIIMLNRRIVPFGERGNSPRIRSKRRRLGKFF